MNLLVDSNILLRMSHLLDPQHLLAVGAVDKLRQQNEHLCIVPQNIYEFWSVATRPLSVNGLGFTNSRAHNELARLRKSFLFLDDIATIFDEWEKLVTIHAV